MKLVLLVIFAFVGLTATVFYYFETHGQIVSVAPNEITKIEFVDGVSGTIAPSITDQKTIEKWTRDLNESKFTRNSNYRLSVILGHVSFEGSDGLSKAEVCANIEQHVLAVDIDFDKPYAYTADDSLLYDDIVDYIKANNEDYYNYQLTLLRHFQVK